MTADSVTAVTSIAWIFRQTRAVHPLSVGHWSRSDFGWQIAAGVGKGMGEAGEPAPALPRGRGRTRAHAFAGAQPGSARGCRHYANVRRHCPNCPAPPACAVSRAPTDNRVKCRGGRAQAQPCRYAATRPGLAPRRAKFKSRAYAGRRGGAFKMFNPPACALAELFPARHKGRGGAAQGGATRTRLAHGLATRLEAARPVGQGWGSRTARGGAAGNARRVKR